MFDLTPSERRVIFIMSGILILAGLFYLFQSYIEKPAIVDYSESDSIFSRLSHKSPLPVKMEKDEITRILSTADVGTERSQPLVKIEKGSININTADKIELESLPRIGPAMAARIIEYRNSQGPFKSLDDLTKVKGIGVKTLNLIKPYLSEIQ